MGPVPYDEELADRIRKALSRRRGITEKKMFGGVTFMVNGNMACGVTGDSLVVRVGREGYVAALSEPNCREFDLTGRPLKGIVLVDPAGVTSPGDLRAWVERGYRYARSLPEK